MAHKKAAGSAKNLRDSQPQYRGVKIFGGQNAVPGNIIIRQQGSKYECGKNTYLAADFTIHASAEGVVHFRKKNFKRFDGRTYLKTVVEVLPASEVVEKKPVAKKELIKKEAVKKEVAPKAEKTEKKAAPKKPATKKETIKKEVAPKAEKKAPAKKPVAKKEAKAE
ncbi:MAG: 50S ribosomal protein L27 [Candidatus Absconditabacteria bacterium]|nr:50S ribosomal protein L27 [Candidatus Absconditabacteria bacterium]MDD3868199.1 50S ribosomal protein L27 [Candidatus Absconditabacteria bacterium]MDD4714586.1 50S ribosomal protein L27 [Candidatus Absconditabacteria bacterium]